MVRIQTYNIEEEVNVYDDYALDLWGRSFNFDHVKGIAEWLKNSADAYITQSKKTKREDRQIILKFSDSKNEGASIECIDFVGMKEANIETAKRWGDPTAAKKGTLKKTHGGHGNGGKFYMRQMFATSNFTTYKNGYLNIFGFNDKKKYGFAKEYHNKKVSPAEALKIAVIDNLEINDKLIEAILNGTTGFTVVRGYRPAGMANNISANKILSHLNNHPQTIGILKQNTVSVTQNNRVICEDLQPKEIRPREDFPNPIIIKIPKILKSKKDNREFNIETCSDEYFQGELILKTTEQAFSRNSRYENLNRIDFLGEIGVVASYQVYELGVNNFPQAAFIYGECRCPILENPKNDMVSNDRVHLEKSDLTNELLQWIAEKIDELAAEISKKQEKERKKINEDITSEYNKVLNEWKNKFMKKILSDILGDNESDKSGTNNEHRTKIKKLLEMPQTMEFSSLKAKIPTETSYKITLKSNTPKIIPIGTIIEIESNNKSIELEKNKILLSEELIRDIEDVGEVAVININVLGKRIGEKGTITATAGRYKAEIDLEVVEKETNSSSKRNFPIVLLSDQDRDPLGIATDGILRLDPRSPLVYQRPQDIDAGIYWINQNSPMAKAIIKHNGCNSTRWKDFLFQRYVDIFVKEALFELQSREPENFSAERIDSDILGDLITNIHSHATEDLLELLFDADYAVSTTQKN